MLSKMIALVAHACDGKIDKGGQPYVLHCFEVMSKIPEDNIQGRIAAMGHDLIEDFPEWTCDRLLQLGFESETVNVIDTVTHRTTESYEEYIMRIRSSVYLDGIAVDIKKADLRHNSDILRMKGITQKDFARLEKYHRAFRYLSGGRVDNYGNTQNMVH